MQKSKALVVMAAILVFFVICSARPAFALPPTPPGLYVDPGVIDIPGGSTDITLITPVRALGTLTVKCVASSNSWSTSIDTGSTCKQEWTFPDDFPGADTNTIGMYDVIADITMNVGKFKWVTSFMVEFFVVPDLPFGTIMAIIACFVAVAGYTKFKRVPMLR